MGSATTQDDRPAIDFSRLVAEHGASCLRLARALARNEALAEEIAQDALLSAYRARDGYRGGSARAWLLTIVRNTAYRTLKSESRRDDDPLLALGVSAGWGSEDPEAAAVAAQRREILESALASLSASDHEVLVLRDIEQLDGDEAAAILEIGLRAMKSRLHRARLRLAAALRQMRELDGGA